MQLHGYLQDLRQGDDSVTTYQQKAKGSLMNSQPQVAPSPSRTSIYMSCRVSVVTFVILLPVYRQKLTLYRILSFIATYPHMNFYIRALSNIVPQLHRYCQRLHSPLLPLLSSRPFQELMAMVLPSSEVEEDIMVGETYAPPLLNTVATISEEEPAGITGSSIVEIGSNTTKNCSKTNPLLVSGGAS
jgi:hypothetical protein